MREIDPGAGRRTVTLPGGRSSLCLVPPTAEGFVEPDDDQESVELGLSQGVFLREQLLLGVEDFKIIGMAGAVAFGGNSYGVLIGGHAAGLLEMGFRVFLPREKLARDLMESFEDCRRVF